MSEIDGGKRIGKEANQMYAIERGGEVKTKTERDGKSRRNQKQQFV